VTVDQDMETENAATGVVRVRNELGLHARPAARLAQEAQRFQSDIVLAVDGQEVDAKSILDVLTLAAPRGADLTIRASGQDARQAVDQLLVMFRNRFGEDK
jgi:phosphocarrier protein HPr